MLAGRWYSSGFCLPGYGCCAAQSSLRPVRDKKGGTHMSARPETSTPAAPASTATPSSRLLGGRISRWIAVILIVAAILVFFSVANDDWFTIVNYTLIAAIAAISLNVLSGYTGQVSIGIAFFLVICVYSAIYLGVDLAYCTF